MEQSFPLNKDQHSNLVLYPEELPQLSLVDLARRFEPLVSSAPLGTPVLVPPFTVEIR